MAEIGVEAKTRVKRYLAVTGAFLLLLGLSGLVVAAGGASAAVASGPSSPPARICGNSSVLDGPSNRPPGSTDVPPGNNSSLFSATLPANTTYYFEAGDHTINTGSYGAYEGLDPGNGDVFAGAPGAILDGDNYNYHAFSGAATDVTIENLTIENFYVPGGDGAVAADGGSDWTIKDDTVQDNTPGSGIYLGTGDTAEDNCLTGNGEYGFGAYATTDISSLTGGPSDVSVTGNEISYNDTCNWEDVPNFPITPPANCSAARGFVGCGCSGAGKFWATEDSMFTDNYAHNDYSNGPWWDTNNAGADVEGNYIADEYAAAVTMEISYNFLIRNNTFVDDAWGVGPNNPGFPSSAVYINGSGSDSRVGAEYDNHSDITGNTFTDNWGGVVLFETSDRYCSSSANSSAGMCTLVDPSVANLATCSDPGDLATEPYIDDCRWKTQNVEVTDNTFDFNASDVGRSCTTSNWCGYNGLFSDYGTYSPYTAYYVASNIMYHQGNLFADNTYSTGWHFVAEVQGASVDSATWTGSPYNEDEGSSFGERTVSDETFGDGVDNMAAWYGVSSISQSTSQAYTGSDSLAVVTNSDYWDVEENYNASITPVTAGDRYLLTAEARAGSASCAIEVTAHWVNSANTDISTAVVGTDTDDSISGWTTYQSDLTAPAGAVGLVWDVAGNGGNGTQYIGELLVQTP